MTILELLAARRGHLSLLVVVLSMRAWLRRPAFSNSGTARRKRLGAMPVRRTSAPRSERAHAVLGGCVHGLARHRGERRQRGDVQHTPRAALAHDCDSGTGAVDDP